MAYDLEKVRTDDGLGEVWTLNFGPQHPATHTTIRLVLKLDGEKVVKCTPHIGYLHSGFEKLGEDLDFNQYVVVTDRMNYVSPLANNIAWHGTVERLMGIEVTPRCRFLRVIMAELSRISDHLLSVGAAALDLGAFTPFLYGFYEREMIYDLFELACGHRFTNSYTRVGGLSQDIPDGWVDRCRVFCGRLPKALDDIESLLTTNRIFVDRTKGIGVVSRDEAIAWSLTGPLARASGVRRDLRKDEPYLCYEEFDFKVPIATGGDCYARYLVRVEEMRQSLRILEQALDKLPVGPVSVDPNTKMTLPPKREVYGSIEGLIHHFEMIMPNRSFTPPLGEVYHANETANGELGFFIVSDGGPRAYRARCRPPSFLHMQAMPLMIEGHQISDVVAVLGSLNIIAAELDR